MKIVKEAKRWVIEATRSDWEQIGLNNKWLDKKRVPPYLPNIKEKVVKFPLKTIAHTTSAKTVPVATEKAVAPKGVKVAQSASQNKDPKAPNFMISTSDQSRSIPSKSKINKALHALGNYFTEIPLDQINSILESNGAILLQEDGTPWSGFVTSGGECGSEKANKVNPFSFDLGVKIGDTYVMANNRLIMSVCTMPSGKLEVIMYVS